MKRKSRYIDVAIKLAKSANLTKDKVKARVFYGEGFYRLVI